MANEYDILTKKFNGFYKVSRLPEENGSCILLKNGLFLNLNGATHTDFKTDCKRVGYDMNLLCKDAICLNNGKNDLNNVPYPYFMAIVTPTKEQYASLKLWLDTLTTEIIEIDVGKDSKTYNIKELGADYIIDIAKDFFGGNGLK